VTGREGCGASGGDVALEMTARFSAVDGSDGGVLPTRVDCVRASGRRREDASVIGRDARAPLMIGLAACRSLREGRAVPTDEIVTA
jgi:hypothetical protein